MRLTHLLGAITAIILVGLTMSSQSVPPGREASANQLARRIVTNELKAQDEDHGHWMYRAEVEDHGKSEKLLRQRMVISVGSYLLTAALFRRSNSGKRTNVFRG